VTAQLLYALRRPRDELPPEALRADLAPLGSAELPAATLLVHRRPNTGRTIVHEIDGHGRLRSVVKLGDASDVALGHEAKVLSALSSCQPGGVRVPEVLDFACTSSRCALRTRVDLSGIVSPPYKWNDHTLAAAGRAIDNLHEALNRVPVSDGPAVPGDAGDTPSHGDFTPWNLFQLKEQGGPAFAVIDYEAVGRWPASWDATRLLVSACEERRIGLGHVARAAKTLNVGSADVTRYIDLHVAQRSELMDTQRRNRFERYATLIRATE
jgi:hypothetical protein